VTKAVKRTLYPPSIAKKVLYQGNWLSFAEWTNLQKPALDVKRKYYFLFSSRFLSMEKAGKYSYYFVELTQFSNVSIIADVHYLNQEIKQVPYKKEAKEYLLSNALVKSTPLKDTYYFSAVEDHKTLLNKIQAVLNSRSHLTPLG
tara:strand:- start:4292 stop:4726 length:435 start_codon:yes stop_codon:yes gene_type:complete